jgi:hypothetical protein
MRSLKSLRNRPSNEGADEDRTPDAPAPDEGDLAIERYDHLDGRELTDQLRQLTQVQLEEIEAYERSHRGRADVLAKLRYLRTSEPLPGYDDLSTEAIAEALVGADAEKVKAVRDYERRFRRRTVVLQETARVLPDSKPSERETKAQAEKDARVRSKMRPR